MDLKLKVTFGAVCLFCLPAAVLGQNINLPDGKGKTELIRDCTACHNTDLIVRVKKTPEAWKKTVYEMADRGVDASDEELDRIVRYLSTNFGIEKTAAIETHPTHISTPMPSPADSLSRFITLNGKIVDDASAAGVETYHLWSGSLQSGK